MKRLYFICIIAFFLFVGIFGYNTSAYYESTTLGVDILNNTIAGGGGGVRIEVPDYIFLGNVSVGGKSPEVKVYVNNTGTVNVTITPELEDSSDEFFQYLLFRLRKTSGGQAVPFTPIGDFSFDIPAPTGSNKYKSEYFYMLLDLTGAEVSVPQSIYNHEAEIRFVAVMD